MQHCSLAVAAGADVLVAGTAIFGDPESVSAAMRRLRGAWAWRNSLIQ